MDIAIITLECSHNAPTTHHTGRKNLWIQRVAGGANLLHSFRIFSVRLQECCGQDYSKSQDRQQVSPRKISAASRTVLDRQFRNANNSYQQERKASSRRSAEGIEAFAHQCLGKTPDAFYSQKLVAGNGRHPISSARSRQRVLPPKSRPLPFMASAIPMLPGSQ